MDSDEHDLAKYDAGMVHFVPSIHSYDDMNDIDRLRVDKLLHEVYRADRRQKVDTPEGASDY